MDLASIAGTLMRLGAPALGGALGGPAGAAIAGSVLDLLGRAFETDPTPEAIGKALERQEAPIVVKRVEAQSAGGIMTELNAILADRQDARATTVKLVERGSSIAWGAPVVSVIVLIGFAILSYLALYPPKDAQRDVVLFLLGGWSSLATAVVGYWVGSSAGSKDKDSMLAALARMPTLAAPPPPPPRGRR